MQWDMYVQCHEYICSRAHANNVKFMSTSAPGHIIDCSELTCSIHTDTVHLISEHVLIGICGI